MQQIDYSVLGTHPEMMVHLEKLPCVMRAYAVHDTARRKAIIVACAEHFYGLTFNEAGSMKVLIDEINAAEQSLEFV